MLHFPSSPLPKAESHSIQVPWFHFVLGLMQSKGFSKLFLPEPLEESDKGGLIGVYIHNVKEEQPHTHQSFF